VKVEKGADLGSVINKPRQSQKLKTTNPLILIDERVN
jgi:hypothetical protein